MRKKGGLGVEYAGVSRGVRGDFAMEVENKVFLFHRGKDGVVGFIGFDSTVRVGGNSSWV